MTNVILYSRVANSDSSISLAFQEEIMIKYCNENNYNIIKSYNEIYSGKSFSRPQWRFLMSYLKNNKDGIDKILVLRFDRFSRDLSKSLNKIKSLEILGVKIECVEANLNDSEISICIPEVE
jgi:DNA invertase Pin-like site-specific DNA recombinase